MRKKIIALFLLALPLFPDAQDLSAHYRLYDVRNQKLTTLGNIAQDVEMADVIFFGEEHNDSAGHYLELELLKALHARFGSRVALSLEMFETDCQLVLNEYLAGHISEERFTRESRPWSNYRDYRPMIEFSKLNRLDVIAANPPRRYVNMVSRKGMASLDSLPKESKKFLPPLPYDTLGGKYREKFMEFMRGGSPGTANFRIYYSQNLWDAGMAYSIYRYWKKNREKKILHVVGKFHCDEKLGTAEQLQNRKSSLSILNISCFSAADFANPDWKKYAHLGDYVFLTDPNLKKTY
jgi:uncharacterized iron-regulated protein